MSIIERTELLKLTQYSGSSLMAQFVLNYNEDMRKIDGHFGDYESAINQRVSDLQDVVNASVATVNAMDGRVTTLEQCCGDVNTTLLNYGSRLVEIERVIDTVSTANIDDLTERVNALENKVETNITDIRILRNDIHEVSDRVTVTENTLVQHGTQLANHENRITTLESCCSEVRGELVRIEGKVDSNKSDTEALKLRVTANEGNIAANAQDITILSGQVQVNTADIEELKQGLADLDPMSQLEVVRQVAINTENIASLQTAVNAQASNLTSVTNRVANAETDIVDLKADNVVLHNEIAQVQGWEQRIATVEQSVSDLGDDVDAVEATVASYDTTLAGLRTDVDTNTSDISAIKTKNLEYDSKIATDEAALSALTARVGANEADLVSIHQTITDDESGLASAVSRIGALESQNGSNTLNTTAQTLSGGVNEVNTKATNADSKAMQALSTASAADTKADEAKADATQASTDAAQAVSNVAQVSSDLSTLDGEVGDLSQLSTTDKTSIVDAINEVNNKNPLAWKLLGSGLDKSSNFSFNLSEPITNFNEIMFVMGSNNTNNNQTSLVFPIQRLSIKIGTSSTAVRIIQTSIADPSNHYLSMRIDFPTASSLSVHDYERRGWTSGNLFVYAR